MNLIFFHSSMEYIKIISMKTIKPNIIASLPFPAANSAVVARANTIICSNIRIGIVTGKVAFGAMKVPQNIATSKGVPIPNTVLMNHPLFM